MQVFLIKSVELCGARSLDIMCYRGAYICGLTPIKTRLQEQARAGRLPERIAPWREMEWC